MRSWGKRPQREEVGWAAVTYLLCGAKGWRWRWGVYNTCAVVIAVVIVSVIVSVSFLVIVIVIILVISISISKITRSTGYHLRQSILRRTAAVVHRRLPRPHPRSPRHQPAAPVDPPPAPVDHSGRHARRPGRGLSGRGPPLSAVFGRRLGDVGERRVGGNCPRGVGGIFGGETSPRWADDSAWGGGSTGWRGCGRVLA